MPKKKKSKRVERALKNGRQELLILKPTDIEYWKMVTLRPPFDGLHIDEAYQRFDITPKINELIRVLESGGLVTELDPVKVVVREDGTMWVVEGQQRYWAHYECKMPMKVMLFKPKTPQAEQTFFLIANNRRAVAAVIKVKAWPLEAGELIHWLNDNENSGFRNEIDFKSSATPVPASTVANAICAGLIGATNPSRMETSLTRLHAAIRDAPDRAYKFAQFFSVLASNVFRLGNGGKLYQNPPRALALACYEQWHRKEVGDAWPMPSPAQIKRIRAIKWEDLFPDRRSKWVPLMRDEILKRWKVKA